MQSKPRFVVVSFVQERAEIVLQGITSKAIFQRLFLDRYEIAGERYHPGKNSTIQGVLLASYESAVVTVPIWTWGGEDGVTRFLCQASDDGSPPAISVFSFLENDLLNQVDKQLRLPRD
jgi:hypothetical protein